LVTAGGDCEDFSIAKFFTLTAMGMDEAHLRMTYVKVPSLNQGHMVVRYFEQLDREPLVLDNVDPRIKPASQRQDLVPIYGLSSTGLWLAERESPGRYVDSPKRHSQWQQLMQAMEAEAADQEQMLCLYQYYDLPATQAHARCD
jgi:hypothetical protein